MFLEQRRTNTCHLSAWQQLPPPFSLPPLTKTADDAIDRDPTHLFGENGDEAAGEVTDQDHRAGNQENHRRPPATRHLFAAI